ncbi:NrdJb [Luteibacter aegosomatissinici]|uniref:TSCPD domain-containing protein n=1 Tax=Luteibacter aegosomatissinici TaxID=2911539 RepID=UPI001FFA4617|nr:NrdJb [Luteibacter aegosomatissinici]UPG93901.1 NrdJb [Luteibacter aegosomatissinici]
MAIKIEKKIKGYNVVKPEDKTTAAAAPAPVKEVAPVAEVIQMHESLERPETLVGNTYKIKSPLFEHALYVTINDIVLNAGTPHEQRRPFELFINSKNMDHFQWIVALTRILSAVFRKGGDVTFIVEELKAVFDPRGGYFKAGGVYMPSIVAEIGAVIEQHMKSIGLIHDPEMDEATKRLIAEKRAAYENANAVGARPARDTVSDKAEAPAADSHTNAAGFPAGATLCAKCNTQALVLMDGCQTCLNCGYSKCG